MTIAQAIQERIKQQKENIETLTAAVPDLRERLRLAEEQADRIEALQLLNESGGDVQVPEVSEAQLRNAKRAERERRRDLERAERDLRLAAVMQEELEKTLKAVKAAKVDQQLKALEDRVPKIAQGLTDAWLQYEKVAAQADELYADLRHLKQLVPVKGVPVSLSRPVPAFPDLERLRKSKPTNNLSHPAKIMQKLGYTDLSKKLQGR